MPHDSFSCDIDAYLNSASLEPTTTRYYLQLLRRNWTYTFPECYFEGDYTPLKKKIRTLNHNECKKLSSAFLHFGAWVNATYGYINKPEAFKILNIPLMRTEELDRIQEFPFENASLRFSTLWRFKFIVYFLCFIEPTPQAVLRLSYQHLHQLSKQTEGRPSACFNELLNQPCIPKKGPIFSSPYNPESLLDKTCIHRVVRRGGFITCQRFLQPRAIAHTYYLLRHNGA